MLSSLLLLAVTEAHASGEAATGITKIFNDFGIDVPLFIAQALSFSVVAYILWRFAFKPVLVTLDERNQKIADGLKHAEETQVRLTAAAQESAAIVKSAQFDAQKIVDEARKIAKEFSEKQQAEAVAQAAALLAKAQQSIELEHKKMLDEARGEIARLVVTTTERVLAKRLTDADRAAYNETAAKELTVI
ncbi:MAG: F0F1 ATP synthase subunit B [Opitutales bacterium]